MEGAKIRFMMVEADNVSPDTISQIISTFAQKAREPAPAIAAPPPPRPLPVAPPARTAPQLPAGPNPKQRRTGGKRGFFTSPQHPGKTFTIKEAAKAANCSESNIYLAVKNNRPLKNGMTFEKSAAGIIPDYADYHGTTRGQADGDMMPLNAQRNSAYDPPAPKDLQREL